MLEKLAEIVREQVEEVGVGEKPYYSLCYLCELEPAKANFPKCSATKEECSKARKKRDLMLARWAVMLVANGLEEEVVDYEIVDKLECLYDADRAAMHIGYRLLDLLEEANPKNKEASVGKEKRGKGEYKCVQRRRTNVSSEGGYK